MKIKVFSRALSGLFLVVFFGGQNCSGMLIQNSTQIPSANVGKTQSNLFWFQRTLSPWFSSIQNTWSYQVAALIVSSVFYKAISVARRYQTPLLAGSFAGAATYVGCSFFGLPHKGFFTGIAFAGVASAIAWILYKAEIKKDLQEIKDLLNEMNTTLSNKVNEKIKEWLEPMLKEINERLTLLEKVSGDLVEIIKDMKVIKKFLNITKDKTLDGMIKENVKPLETQLLDLTKLLIEKYAKTSANIQSSK